MMQVNEKSEIWKRRLKRTSADDMARGHGVSEGYEYSAGAWRRSGLLPRHSAAMKYIAPAGNILSRSRRAE
jgi:hypothetical protein